MIESRGSVYTLAAECIIPAKSSSLDGNINAFEQKCVYMPLMKQPHAAPINNKTKKAQLMPRPTLELLKRTTENVLQLSFSAVFHLF